jgi:broad specificity phosphatase PhoE
MTLLLIRHGEMQGDPYACPERPVEGCLSAAGVAQARAAREALAGTPIDVAFSSPYGRALQTAEIVLEGRDAPLTVLDFLKEWLPNRALDSLPPQEYERIVALQDDLYVEETWCTELGEGCFDMYARICPPFMKVLDEHGIHQRLGGFVCDAGARELTVAVFAHGGSLSVLLTFILGLPPFPLSRFSFELTGVARVAFVERKGIFHPQLVLPPASSGVDQ